MITSVAIIESLPPGEVRTGESLAQKLNSDGFSASYYFASDLSSFLSAIQNVERISRTSSELVALHFEVHGSSAGFQLADGSLVTWQTVKSDIQRLNFAQKNNLLITMAVCQGLWLLDIISAIDTSPFHSLVACDEVVYLPGIERGFPAFYRSLLGGKDLHASVFELNLAQNGLNPDYRIVSSEQMFADAYRKYLTERSSPEFLRKRAGMMFDIFASGGWLPPTAKDQVTRSIVEIIKAQEEPFFERFREKFFMHDAYPENMAKFCPTFEELSIVAGTNTTEH